MKQEQAGGCQRGKRIRRNGGTVWVCSTVEICRGEALAGERLGKQEKLEKNARKTGVK